MYFRIALAVVTLFWGTMTFLLWRAEYGDRNQAGNAVPLEVVWKKILTAPDNSTLDIYHKGKKAGFCRWAATVGEDPRARKGVVDGQPPEGMVTRPTGYRLDLDGNLNETEDISRVHFNLELKLSNPRAQTSNGTCGNFNYLKRIKKFSSAPISGATARSASFRLPICAIPRPWLAIWESPCRWC
jgi:hypothetical protein